MRDGEYTNGLWICLIKANINTKGWAGFLPAGSVPSLFSIKKKDAISHNSVLIAGNQENPSHSTCSPWEWGMLHSFFTTFRIRCFVSSISQSDWKVLCLQVQLVSHRLNAPGKSHGSPNRELGADPTYLHILYHRIGVCPVYNHIGHDTSIGRKTEVKGTDIGNSFPSNRIHASFVSWERTVPSTGGLPGFVYHTLFTWLLTSCGSRMTR